MSARICLIGFGEVGEILADDLAARGVDLSVWDIQFADAYSKPARAAAARKMRMGAGAKDATREADLIISAVTARQTGAAARSVAAGLAPGAYYFDLNSAAPSSSIQAAAIIERAGGRYVEASVMSPVPPKRSASPILLGGPNAEDFLPLAHDLGFSGARIFSPTLGAASAAKLCRSVLIKGLEALLIESLTTARHYNVEDTVLASLSDLLPGADWPTLSRYMISRAITHGRRRAEEMQEAVRTVSDAGVAPLMSGSCVGRQAEAARYASALDNEELGAMLDTILAHITPPEPRL